MYFGCWIYFSICFMWTNIPYFAIEYDVEFDNLLIILFIPQIYSAYTFIFFYGKSDIVFCNN